MHRIDTKTPAYLDDSQITKPKRLCALNSVCGLHLVTTNTDAGSIKTTATHTLTCEKRNQNISPATIAIWEQGNTPHSYEWENIGQQSQLTILNEGESPLAFQLISAACRAFATPDNELLQLLGWGKEAITTKITSNEQEAWTEFWRRFPSMLQIVAGNHLQAIRSHGGHVIQLSTDGSLIHMQAWLPHSDTLIKKLLKYTWNTSIPTQSALQQTWSSDWVLHYIFPTDWHQKINLNNKRPRTFVILPRALWISARTLLRKVG